MFARLRSLYAPSVVRCVAAASLVIAAHRATADTHIWSGAFSQNFQGANNWSPTGVPVDGDTANISVASADVFLSAATRVDNLSIVGGALLRTNARTLKVDDSVTLIKSSNGEDTILRLSSGATGIDLDAAVTNVTNGAQIVMEPDSQWRIVESALVGAGSSVSGSGLIEITGVFGSGFNNNGSLEVQAMTLRRAVHAGSTFDLDGTGESGYVNIVSHLDLQTSLSDPFDGRWDQQFTSAASVGDFTLGPGGEMDFFSGVGPAPTSFGGRHLRFDGDVDVRLATGLGSGETHFNGDTITFGDGASIGIAFDTQLVTDGHLFLDSVLYPGAGVQLHYGDVTVTGNALNLGGQFILDDHQYRQFNVEQGASIVASTLGSLYARVVVEQNGLIDVRGPLAIQGSVSLNGSNAIIRAQDTLDLAGDVLDKLITGTGRFEADVELENVVLRPGDDSGPGSLYFEALECVSSIVEFDVGPNGSDLLIVEGAAALASPQLEMLLEPGYIPAPGSVFPLVSAGSLTGEFHGGGIEIFGTGPGQLFGLHYEADSVVAYVPLIGDANLDGTVSGADYTNWADHFGGSGGWRDGDFNGDGQVSGADYTIWADHFGESVSLAVAPLPVPEPSSGLLAAAGAALWMVRRRGSRWAAALLASVGASADLERASADTHHWSSIVSQNFQGSNNWSPTGVPVDGDTAIIGSATANVFLSAAAHVDHLTLNNGSRLRTNGHTLRVDDDLTLVKTPGGGNVSLTLSSGAGGVDLVARHTTLSNGAALALQVDSQWEILDWATVSAASTVSGAGLIEITGASSQGYNNDGTLASEGLTLRRALQAGSTFDLDGRTENGSVNVLGSLDLQANLADSFDGQWDQQFAAVADVADFTLGPAGEMNFFSGFGATATIFAGDDLNFAGDVNVRLTTGFSDGETNVFGDVITFESGSQINRLQGTQLITDGELVLRNTHIYGDGRLLHYGDVTVAGDAVVQGGEFYIDHHEYRQLTIEPGASLVAEAFGVDSTTSAAVLVREGGRIDLGSPWFGIEGSVHLQGADAIFRSEHPFSISGEDYEHVVAGTGRFEADVTLDGVTLRPGEATGPGSLYFDGLSVLNSLVEFEIGPAGADRLIVDGTAALAAGVILLLDDGFQPGPGAVIPLLQAAAVTGQFSGLSAHPFGAEPGQFLVVHHNPDSVVAYAPLVGDANLDGRVSGADYTNWADHFGQAGDWQDGDFNGDGQVSGADYTIWADHFGESVSLAAAPLPVPEPRTGLLALVAACGGWLAFRRGRRSGLRAGCWIAIASVPSLAGAVDRTWTGALNQVFGTAGNWSPNGAPTVADNLTIGLDAANVVLNGNGAASTLTLNNGAVLSTAGFNLAIRNDTVLDENTAASVRLLVNPGGSPVDFNTNHLDVLSGAEFMLQGGLATIDDIATIDASSTLRGQGTVQFTSTNTAEGLVNNGLVVAAGGANDVLTLRATGGARLDLDGTTESGGVFFHSTGVDLVIDGPLADEFDGQFIVGSGNQATFHAPATLDGFVSLTGGASGAAAMDGSALTYVGALSVSGDAQHPAPAIFGPTAAVSVDAGGRLSLGEATFQGGTFQGAGAMACDVGVQVQAPTTIQLAEFDLDGAGESASLSIDADFTLQIQHLDSGGGDTFDGTLRATNASFVVDNQPNSWTIQGAVKLADGTLAGDRVVIAGLLQAGGTSSIESEVTLGPSGQVNVDSGANLAFERSVSLQGGALTGGDVVFAGPVSVEAPTTIVGSLIDLDGHETTSVTVRTDGALSIASDQIDGDDAFHGELHLGRLGDGDLHVEVADGAWEMAGTMTLTNNAPLTPTIDVTGDRMRVTGTIATDGTFTSYALGVETEFDDALLDIGPFTGLQLTKDAVFEDIRATGGAFGVSGDLLVTGPALITTSSFAMGAGPGIGTTAIEYASLTISADLGEVTRNITVRSSMDPVRPASLRVGGSQWQLAAGTLDLADPLSSLAGAFSDDPVLQLTGGTLAGCGLVNSPVEVQAGGRVSPGSALSDPTFMLRVTDFHLLDSQATLELQLGGLGEFEFDSIAAGPGASIGLGGTLHLELVDGYVPGSGDVITIVRFDDGALNAKFTDVQGSVFGAEAGAFLAVVYRDDRVLLYCPLPGDANFDGLVSGADYTIWADHFGNASPWDGGDFNGDGQVSGADYTIWADNFGASVSLDVPAAPVPEPSAMCLAALGATGLACLRQRRAGH